MKAILVIDVDEDMIGEVDYTVLNKAEMVNGRSELKPLPKKVKANNGLAERMMAVGWNDCLDKIVGKENEE